MNHRLAALSAEYDLLALRPITEQDLNHISTQLDCDILSIDTGTRYPFPFKRKTLSSATARGLRIELCYGPGFESSDKVARRNLCSNATNVIRSSKGRNIIISSEAKKALACRGPWDVVNLATVWGLPQDRGLEAINREARAVVVRAHLRQTSFRGVVDVVYGGENPVMKDKEESANEGNKETNKPLSKTAKRKLAFQEKKRESKRQKVDKELEKRGVEKQ